MIKLEDVGYEYGITDSTIESVYGLPSVDTYFAFGGQMSVEALLLQISGGLNADVRLRGNYLSDALIDYTLACEKAGGFVTPSKSVKKALYNAVDFNGRIWASAKLDLGALGTLAGGTGELAISKTMLSGSITGELWPDIRKKVGFTYSFKKNDLDFDVMSMAFGASYNNNIFEDGEVTVTNLIDAGSYQVPGDGWRAMRLVETGGDRPTAEADQIATVYADQEYDWVDIVITPTDGDPRTIRLEGELGWFETPNEYSERGTYSLNYLIPEEGKYQFSTVGGNDHSYWLTGFAELPEYTEVYTSVPASGTTLQTNWTLNDTAANGDALLTRLLLVDAQTGDIALDLTAPETNVDDSNVNIGEYPLASTGSFTADLPETLGSGRYYVSAELLRQETEVVTLFEGTEDEDTQEVTEYVTLSILRSAEFDYTNPESPAAPANIRTTYAGNGAFNVAWDSVEGADGYMVTILDSEGNEIPGITELDVTTTEFVTELPCEVMIQGGLVTTQEVLDDAGNVLDEGGDQYGLEYGNTYQIEVQAYKNITKSGTTGEGEDEREYEYVLHILGLTNSINYELPTPQIPVLTVSLEGGNAIDGGEEGISYISTNSTEPTLIIGSSEAAAINVYLNESQTPVYTSSSPETSANVSIPLQEGDGIYNVRITASVGEDNAESGMTISLDTVAPILNVDGDSFTAAQGQLLLNGFTELGAAVTMNGTPLTLSGGLFYEEVTVAQTGDMVELLAFDEAGNTTSRIFGVLYEQTILSPGVTITSPTTGQSPDTEATGTGNFTIGSVSWTPADNLFKKTTQYIAALTLTADLGYTFTGMTEPTINGYSATVADNTGETVTLSYTFAATGENTLTGMELVTAPAKLSYTHGDTLDLTGLSVKLTYNDAAEEIVSVNDFESKNISTNPADGSIITMSLNGTAITVSCGSYSVNAGTLTVAKADDSVAHNHIYDGEWKSDATGHWQVCSCGDKSSVAAHTSGDWIIDTLPTQTANGSRQKQCTTCGYITETETISATGISYKNKITGGATQLWEIDPTKEATIICDGDIEDFVGLQVDGELVDRENYTVISGSTIITLKPAYLQTLSAGAHTIELLYTDGSVQTNLTIQTAENNNDDSDQTNNNQTDNNQTDNNQTNNNQTNNDQAAGNNPTVSPHTDDTINVISPEANEGHNNIPWFLLGGTILITLSVTIGVAVKRRKH
jgi:hypothetical protein